MKEDLPQLKRSLTSNQMQMIALGGTIGVGLFMGSSSTIKWTGPSVLLAYGFAGLILYLVMRALGEILYVNPSTGSFADYATNYIHPLAGYLTMWSNIFQFIVVGISEVVAVSQYLNYWWPNLPGWVSSVVVIATLTLANLVSTKAYGAIEFYFALIKVLTIILMIIIGVLVIFMGLGNHWRPVGLSNLWAHGGFFTGGVKGFLFALSIVVGSYQGIELLGITAGEAANPKKAIVASVKSIVWRILIFYLGAIFVIVAIFPWNQLATVGSPFVETFSKVGITGAAGIINFVVLTAAMSGTNSGIYSASRMLYKLSQEGKVPKIFGKLSSHRVPSVAILTISFGILLGIILNIFLSSFKGGAVNLFVLIYSSSVLPGMVPWFVILLSELRFRRANPEIIQNHPFVMPLYPMSNYLAIISLLLIVVFMFINPDTRASVTVGFVFLMVLTINFIIKFRRKRG
ncbi:amino acid permease [Pediococcus pentosaceus]|jgi:AAT family amino acid transporter|uniref:Amino acid/polyamine/organocation transporter, APC superfamily n=1 Tax=Pediococcus pentosaceus (strain ATCC 25745 / CCUG 21536 / LMG 10740 / 183-1w) TaxID=278197 RepID=Q03FU6_PEDPA|nr:MULTISPECIES: amino acid permease [Pediococcus]ABJ67926.1 amino acid/polyamine/organocation transporter, APC superfamily [Pediococcus pentosaceus ATCC 25745]ANI97981.1 amino acid permease [Pediococcus pentosaceus]ASC08579.1 Proline-specific permease [Pediococcus pentosaceus]AVL01427.1 amino acid permease [Pediococcus pentosaceus]KAF5440936.1 amino acid permease [Pediococcus sp. EKM202D]